MVKFSVVVVTYNRIDLLKECIQHIDRQSLQPNNVIIIDNCSDDGTFELLEELVGQHDNWIVKHEIENVGGSGGYYDGMKIAYNTDSEWFLLIDDDAMIDENYLCYISSSIENHNKILAFSGTVKTNGRIILEHRRRMIRYEVDVPIDEYRQEEFEYDLSSFCGVVINRKIPELVGYPEKDFFIWYDDTEYCMRINKFSKIVNVNKAILNHKTKNYETKEGDSLSKLSWKTYYGYRNVIYSYCKHKKKKKAVIFALRRIKEVLRNKRKYPNQKETAKYNFSMVLDSINDGFRKKLGKNSKYLPG